MPRLAPALAGLLVAAAPAAADVTPREVWDDWMTSMGDGDAKITTEAVLEGEDRLTVKGLSVVDGTEAEGRYAVEVDAITLVQNDDGTVGVTVSPEYPIVLTDTDEDGAVRETRLSVRHPDLEMTVSDEGGQRTHAFAAPEVRVTIEEVLENGEPLDLSGSMLVSGAEGRYDTGEAVDGQSVFSASQLEVSFGGTDPDSGDQFDLAVGMEGLDSKNMLQLVGPDAAAMAREMPEGTSRDAVFTTTASSFTFDTENDDESVRLIGTVGPGRADVSLSPQGLFYAGEGEEATLAISGNTMPLPQIAIEIGQASSGFAMPLLASDEAQPYDFTLSMLDVVLDEGLWNMVDPAGILPRDPGAIIVDVSGDVVLNQDADAAGVVEDMTGEVQTVEINTVRLEMAEAKAVASGLLSLTEVAGETLPVGELGVTITGFNRLLERLVQAGILPQEQAMGTRMMLGMFAKPGAGADELISNIRFTEDGRIFVNEQQVR